MNLFKKSLVLLILAGAFSCFERGTTVGDNPFAPANRTLYVSDASTAEDPDGTVNYPFRRINDAIEYAKNGSYDRIYVFDGRYNEQINIGDLHDIIIEGQSRENTTITFDNSVDYIVRFSSGAYNVTLKNFNLFADASVNTAMLSVSGMSGTVTAENLYFDGNTNAMIAIDIEESDNHDVFTIADSVFPAGFSTAVQLRPRRTRITGCEFSQDISEIAISFSPNDKEYNYSEFDVSIEDSVFYHYGVTLNSVLISSTSWSLTLGRVYINGNSFILNDYDNYAIDVVASAMTMYFDTIEITNNYFQGLTPAADTAIRMGISTMYGNVVRMDNNSFTNVRFPIYLNQIQNVTEVKVENSYFNECERSIILSSPSGMDFYVYNSHFNYNSSSAVEISTSAAANSYNNFVFSQCYFDGNDIAILYNDSIATGNMFTVQNSFFGTFSTNVARNISYTGRDGDVTIYNNLFMGIVSTSIPDVDISAGDYSGTGMVLDVSGNDFIGDNIGLNIYVPVPEIYTWFIRNNNFNTPSGSSSIDTIYIYYSAGGNPVEFSGNNIYSNTMGYSVNTNTAANLSCTATNNFYNAYNPGVNNCLTVFTGCGAGCNSTTPPAF